MNGIPKFQENGLLTMANEHSLSDWFAKNANNKRVLGRISQLQFLEKAAVHKQSRAVRTDSPKLRKLKGTKTIAASMNPRP